MKKRTAICVIAMLLLTMSGAATVHAESYQGKDTWKVAFDGERMNSNFGNSSLSDDLPREFQPGDDVTFSIALENTAEKATDWYMTNEVLTTLEDSQKAASGGNYTYRLTYTDSLGGQRTLYDSESVGGEKEGAKSEGLHEATDSLEEFLYLDRLEAGQRGAVSLYVKVDGETQGNDYQDTLSSLQMNFAAEQAQTAGREENTQPTTTPTTSAGGGTQNTSESKDAAGATQAAGQPKAGEQPSGKAVQTGDERNMLPWTLASLASGLALLALAVGEHRRKKGGRA